MNKGAGRVVGLFSAILLLAACASPPQPGPTERIVLIPDRNGHVGVIQINVAAGTTNLSEAYSATRIQGANVSTERLGEEDVKRRYGTVLEGLPRSPQSYLLNFEFGTDRLTTRSRDLTVNIQRDLQQFPAPEVVLIGHTDAVGEAAFNEKLALDRAIRVRDMLVADGISREGIQIFGRGSREPLVAARPGVPEPRNRRVEIKLR